MTETGLPPEAVGGLRPAEAGVLVDRGPRPAHIVATVVDLAQRGWLGIAAHENDGEGDADGDGGEDRNGDGDWTFSRVRSPAQWLAQRRELARYERMLLHGIFGHRSQVRFTRIVSGGIRRVYHRLTQDALAQGWLGPTAAVPGLDTETEQLRGELRAMRVTLEGLQPPAGVDELEFYSRWLPYALALGLMPAWAQRLDVLGAAAIPTGNGNLFPSEDIALTSWWSGSFATQMTGAVDSWSHHSGGSGGIWGHDGGGHSHHAGHHGGHHGHHGGFDGGHHGGFDGGGGDGGGGW